MATTQKAQKAQKAERYELAEIATFAHQVTGVSVSEDGRFFVNFPRWTEDAPVSVAELRGDGEVVPYPDREWNAWRNSKKNEMTPHDHWVCVQSIVADGRGSLWVLDPAAPATSHLVPGGAKLVQVDLATDRVVRTIAFGEDVAPEGSYLNDVRFSPDGRWAYITDSGAKGALVVVDLEKGEGRRVLHGHPSTQPEKDVVVKVDGRPLRRPDGRGAEFAADGIALSPDGKTLYWQAIKGKTLYSLPTDALTGWATASFVPEMLSDRTLESKIVTVGENGPADGLLIARKDGRMYVTSPQDDAVKVRDLTSKGSGLTTLVQDPQLRWPDTFSEGPDGTIYVTASHIQDMPWYVPGNPKQVRTQLFKLEQSG